MALLGVMVFCALVDLPIRFKIAGTSGLGAGTFAAAGVIWAVFLIRPVISGSCAA